jgi:hypothetical protein
MILSHHHKVTTANSIIVLQSGQLALDHSIRIEAPNEVHELSSVTLALVVAAVVTGGGSPVATGYRVRCSHCLRVTGVSGYQNGEEVRGMKMGNKPLCIRVLGGDGHFESTRAEKKASCVAKSRPTHEARS